eukprot:3479547-Pyramimonas_sp.AAC.1
MSRAGARIQRIQATQGGHPMGYLTWLPRTGATCSNVSKPPMGVSNMIVPSKDRVPPRRVSNMVVPGNDHVFKVSRPPNNVSSMVVQS